MKNIFLSYARDDYPHAHKLLSALRGVSVKGWMDDADIAAGTAVGDAVRSAIRDSDAVVVLVSPMALQNSWVDFEIGAGLALGKQIIPILVEGGDDEGGLPEPLSELKALDARDRPAEEVARDVEKALMALQD